MVHMCQSRTKSSLNSWPSSNSNWEGKTDASVGFQRDAQISAETRADSSGHRNSGS